MSIGQIAPFPSRLKPMPVRLVDEPFSNPEWLFEPKLDGFRAIAFLRDGSVRLVSRNGNDLTDGYPGIAHELESLSDDSLVLDGEIVALNDKGLPDFGLLQRSSGFRRFAGASANDETATIVYYPFDLLYARTRSLLEVRLTERKELLANYLKPVDSVREVEYVEAEGEAFFESSQQTGLEGMVARRKDSHYRPGKPNRLWLKVKAVKTADLVVAGYTEGTGARATTFGALVLGYYENAELKYAGRVGSGFDSMVLERMLQVLETLRTDQPAFSDTPEELRGGAKWVRPELVVSVKFAEWTREGMLRAPVFLGLSADTGAALPDGVVGSD